MSALLAEEEPGAREILYNIAQVRSTAVTAERKGQGGGYRPQVVAFRIEITL